MKRILVICGLSVAALASLAMTEGRAYAMRVYGAPCGRASGLAGFLQQVHFLPAGSCKASGNPASPCSNAGASCNIADPLSGGPPAGKCTAVGSTCSCVASAPGPT
jgi:hypothetical protein